MAVLHLENVPEEVMRELQEAAQREHQTPEEKAVRVLQDALLHPGTIERSRVPEVLERIRRNPIVPPPDMPDSVELLREDRNR